MTHNDAVCASSKSSVKPTTINGAVSHITFAIMYADDTNIFIQGKDLQNNGKVLNIEIKKLSICL